MIHQIIKSESEFDMNLFPPQKIFSWKGCSRSHFLDLHRIRPRVLYSSFNPLMKYSVHLCTRQKKKTILISLRIWSILLPHYLVTTSFCTDQMSRLIFELTPRVPQANKNGTTVGIMWMNVKINVLNRQIIIFGFMVRCYFMLSQIHLAASVAGQ